MYRLTDPALEVILKQFHPQEYDPPHTDIRKWAHSLESLCDTYGIPDVQRPQCATRFIKNELRTELLSVLDKAQVDFGPVHWDRFKAFIVVFDQHFREQWEKLWFYERHPKRTGTTLGVIGGVLLAPAALAYAGVTSAGVAAGSIPATVQYIVYGRATGGLFSLLHSAGSATLLQSAGAATLLKSAGATTILSSVGTATTGAGVVTGGAGALVVATNDQPVNSISGGALHQAAESIGQGDGNGNPPPPYDTTVPEEYLLTHKAVLAIVESWDVGTYNPPGTNCTTWLDKIHKLCDQYGIPDSQRAPCAMGHMRADCKQAAHTAGCYDMTWDAFTAWLRRHDSEERKSTNRKIVELSADKSVM